MALHMRKTLMMKTKSRIAWFVLTALLFSDTVNANSRASVVGDWYGRGQPGGDTITVYLDHIKADGTFVSEFERCLGKKGSDIVESGTWAASTEILHVNTKVNVSNDGKTWIYRIVAALPESRDELGYEFNAKRVSPDFRLPGCLQIS
jgi:hypothetical protein